MLVACGPFFFIVQQGNLYLKRIIIPVDIRWSEFNPFLNIWPSAILIGVLVAVAYLYDTYQFKGLWSFLKTVLEGWIGGVLLGAILVNIALCLIAFLNGYFDNAPVQEHHAVVVDKVVTLNKNYSSYYVIVPDWRTADEEVMVKLYIGSHQEGYQLNQRIDIPSQISVSTRPGLFGLEWVVGVEQP